MSELSKMLKLLGEEVLRRAVRKIFPPDTPVTEEERGDRFGIMHGSRQYTLYWGDLHGHSSLSTEAVGTPDEYYQYARHTRRLDFCAMTDHDFSLDDEKWVIIQEKASQHNVPGSFTTFVAYEWTSPFGHKVVLFPDTKVPQRVMVRSNRKEDNPYALWKFLKPFGAITIPHHTFSFKVTTDWQYRDNLMQPLVEIYSKHGSCESYGSAPVPFKVSNEKGRSVKDALDQGHRFGFVGCSDTHCSKPGSKESMELLTHRLVLKYSSGLTGVYATSFDRAGIWEALTKRHTFATTGVRLYFDFRFGEALMGSEIKAHNVEPISIFCVAPEPISLLEIIKDGEPVHRLKPQNDRVETTWTDEKVTKGDSYYYARLTLETGDRAWVSPIYVHYL